MSSLARQLRVPEFPKITNNSILCCPGRRLHIISFYHAARGLGVREFTPGVMAHFFRTEYYVIKGHQLKWIRISLQIIPLLLFLWHSLHLKPDPIEGGWSGRRALSG
jgi:hypothetical protein